MAEVPVLWATVLQREENWKGAGQHAAEPGWPGACFLRGGIALFSGVTANAATPELLSSAGSPGAESRRHGAGGA